jgi:phosphate transport system permease protein
MTGYIARISGGDVAYDTPEYDAIFAIGFLLFIMTLAMNLISRKISSHFREVYE